MSCINCSSPCNCLITEDGFFANRPLDGRRNTVVTGSGTVEDPFEIQFQQSEFYRPPSIQINRPSNSSTTTDTSNSQASNVTGQINLWTTIYESPQEVLVFVPQNIAADTASTFGFFNIVGASVTFAASNTTGARKIMIESLDPRCNRRVFSGNTQHGLSADSTILTCSLLVPGCFTQTPLSNWVLYARQESGGNINLSNIKFWMTTL